MTKSTRWILGFILILSSKGFSQQRDSILTTAESKRLKGTERAIAYAADQFTLARPLSIKLKNTSSHQFSSTYRGEQLPKGKVQDFEQVEVGSTIHLLKKSKWVLGTTLNYRYTHIGTCCAENTISAPTALLDGGLHHWQTSVNLTHFSKLFDKNVIYTSSLIFGGSDKNFEKVSGLMTGTMVLKANQNTKLMTGLIVILEKGANIPIIPSFSYEQKFNNGWTFDLMLPRNIHLRKFVSQNQGRISLGTEIDVTKFFLYNIEGFKRRYEYRQVDLYTGLTYEHAIGKVILTAKTGMEITPTGKLVEKGKSFRHPFYKTQHDPAFYFNIGISINPYNFFGQALKP